MMNLWYVLMCILKQDIISKYMGKGELGWMRMNERRLFVVL